MKSPVFRDNLNSLLFPLHSADDICTSANFTAARRILCCHSSFFPSSICPSFSSSFSSSSSSLLYYSMSSILPYTLVQDNDVLPDSLSRFWSQCRTFGKREKMSSVLMFTKRLYIRSNTLVSICQLSRQLSIRFFWESVQGQWHSDGSPCQASEQDTGRNRVCVCVCVCTFICATFSVHIHLEMEKKKQKMKNDLFSEFTHLLLWQYI